MKALTVLECYGCAICYVVLHSLNWPVVLSLPDTLHLPVGPHGAFAVSAPVACVSVWAMCVLPLLLIKVKYLAVFGSIGLVAVSTLFVVSTVAPSFATPSEPQPIGSLCAQLDSSLTEADMMGERVWVRPDGLGVGVGLVLFCFGGHATFPEIYSQMAASERPHFDRAINVGFLVAATFFTVLSAAGYYYYGSCAADALTLNLMHTSPLLGRISTVCVLANTFFSFPTFCAPVVRILTELIHSAKTVESLEADVVPPTKEELWRAAVVGRYEALSAKIDAIGAAILHLASVSSSTSEGKSKLPREITAALRAPSQKAPTHCLDSGETSSMSSMSAGVGDLGVDEGSRGGADDDDDDLRQAASFLQAMSGRSLLVRIGLVIVAAILAVSVPNFGFVVALMGAFTTMLVSFILPTAFFLKVRAHALNRLQKALCVGTLLIGFAGMAIGLTNTLSGDA
jgi:amino acid permease